jgi:hypothetical protein
MSKQPELILEEQLIARLQELGYAYVQVGNEDELIKNQYHHVLRQGI